MIEHDGDGSAAPESNGVLCKGDTLHEVEDHHFVTLLYSYVIYGCFAGRSDTLAYPASAHHRLRTGVSGLSFADQ